MRGGGGLLASVLYYWLAGNLAVDTLCPGRSSCPPPRRNGRGTPDGSPPPGGKTYAATSRRCFCRAGATNVPDLLPMPPAM